MLSFQPLTVSPWSTDACDRPSVPVLCVTLRQEIHQEPGSGISQDAFENKINSPVLLLLTEKEQRLVTSQYCH